MRVVSVQEMRSIERETIEKIGFSEGLIIENVGRSAAEYLDQIEWTKKYHNEIIILVGAGNNGADGLATARHLVNKGHSTRAFLLFDPSDMKAGFKQQLDLAHGFGVKISQISKSDQLESYFSQTGGPFIVIDAILGVGLRLPLSNYLFDIVNCANRYANYMVAMDIATGINCDSGAMKGNAIKADLTMAVGLPKYGHYIGEGAVHSGETIVLDGCFPKEQIANGDKALLTLETIRDFQFDRNKFAHKNKFGHCLIVGGSPGLTGAANLAAMAALKVGTGVVTASSWHECYGELCSRVIPEVITGTIPTGPEEVEDTIKRLEQWDSIVVGPGLGRNEQSRDIVLQILNHFSGPVIIDADAIRVLDYKKDLDLISRRKGATVFTPHMGEFADFIGVKTDDVLERPLDYLKEIIDGLNCCFVMKGPASYLGFPNGQIYINYYPNDGMATAGSGDVLAGMMGGLLAQYSSAHKVDNPFEDKSILFRSLCLGMLAHSLAGKEAARIEGVRAMTAASIVDHLGTAFGIIEHGEPIRA